MLPKISTTTFEVIQPSTKKPLLLRPFLVKEEKILLVAKESGDDGDVYNAVKSIINNCVLDEEFDVDKIPVYDLEYLFIKLRAQSVNNIIKFQVEDSDDGIVYDLETNLDDVEIIFPENHTNKFMIDEQIGVIMQHPTPALSEKLKSLDNVTDIIYETIKNCIYSVFDENDTYLWGPEPDHEKDVFLESIPVEVYKEIGEFFKTSPKIEHVVTYTNSQGKEKKVIFRNINDFFMLG